MTAIRPRCLTKGSTVAMVAPASGTDKEKVDLSASRLKSLGLNVKIYPSCYQRHGWMSGSDQQRTKDLQDSFADPQIDGILCMRGGCGAPRLLDLLDYDKISKTPKILAGYSDITALHIAISQRCNFSTYHTPMPTTELYKEDLDEYTLNSWKNMLFNPHPQGPLENPPETPIKTLVSGIATGDLIGGNLTLITSLMGTPYEINTKGKILFIEDVEEKYTRIDRMLLQLRQSGKLEEAAGILLGTWTGCAPTDPQHTLTLEEIFQEIISPVGKPTLYNFQCGHGLPSLSLMMGATIRLDGNTGEIHMV